MKKLYEIDLNKVRELTKENERVSPTLDKLLSIEKDYKPFRYSELRLSTEGILYYPTHTSSKRVRIGSYLYDQEDMVCVLETTNALSESLVIADFSTIERFKDEDSKFHFNRVLNMYRAMREPISELSLLLGNYVEWLSERHPGGLDGRDINIWILQLQQFCRDLDFIYQDKDIVPLLDILGSILNRDSVRPLDLPTTRLKEGKTKYEINARRFPSKAKDSILKFQEEILSDLYVSKIKGDDFFLDIVALVQALCECPRLVNECVECEQDIPDTIHFHRNHKLCTRISELVHASLEDMRFPKLLEIFSEDNRSRCFKFLQENDLEGVMRDYTSLHSESWIEYGTNPERLVEEIYRTGEGQFRYVFRESDIRYDPYHTPLDTLSVTYGQVDTASTYIDLLVTSSDRENFRQIATTISKEDESDLNLICPVWRYQKDYESAPRLQRLASFSDIKESKCTDYKLNTESVKSFFRSMKERCK